MCLIVQIFNYDGLNEWLSVHNAVALPYWAVYFWLIVCCLWVNCGLISKTPFFPELQNQSHSMSLYSWSNSKWADYGWNHFLHPVCLITFYFSFYCTTWLATTNSTKLIIPGMHMAFSLYVCKYVQTVDLKKKKSPSWKHEGSCLMEERHEGVEGWNCLLMASLSPSCESCSCLGVLRQIEVAHVGTTPSRQQLTFFPSHTIWPQQINFGLLGKESDPAGCWLTNM